MVEIQAVQTNTFGAVRAEALFVSPLQSSESPDEDRVRSAVAQTLQQLGIRGCATQMATEFGDQPDVAVARMTWAVAMVHIIYSAPAAIPAHAPQPLALAG